SSPGVRVVYASEHQSTAALEILVHALAAGVSERYKAFHLTWPDELTETFPIRGLPADWRASPPPSSAMQIGDAWVREGRSAVLALPSALSPADTNFLLNPDHPGFRRVKIGQPIEFEFDPRLLRR
ncbi:MAG TPA: RES family NAD+ phosphorylase, partial [Chthoniobacterales bacterium]|nr:RES family NAD+ phosphorylase [Chthoniobacterales bacterium]